MPILHIKKQMETRNGWVPCPREQNGGVPQAELVPRSQLPPCKGPPRPCCWAPRRPSALAAVASALLFLMRSSSCQLPPASRHVGREGRWGVRGQ